MTTKEQVIVWSEQADDYADKKLQCEGEYHPDWHEVRDAYFATLVGNAKLEEAAKKCVCEDAKPKCTECAKWRKEQAANREWIEGVAEGRRIVEKLAAKKQI